jgi:hypothetical protein
MCTCPQFNSRVCVSIDSLQEPLLHLDPFLLHRNLSGRTCRTLECLREIQNKGNSRMDDQSQSCYRVRTNKYLVISTLGVIMAATTSWNRTPKGRTLAYCFSNSCVCPLGAITISNIEGTVTFRGTIGRYSVVIILSGSSYQCPVHQLYSNMKGLSFI